MRWPHNGSMTVIDDYIAGFEGVQREQLARLAEVLREEMPGADERISYRLPTLILTRATTGDPKSGSKPVKVRVHFAAHTSHVGLYPGPDALAAVEDELADYVHAKGSIQFPSDKPLPIDLIRRIVRAGLARGGA